MATARSFNNYGKMREALQKAMGQVVKKACLDIEAGAKRRAPVDTGFLRSSIYTKTADGSSYGNGAQNGPMLPEIGDEANETTAYVAVGATYGVYVEYGSSHGPAQPYLTPASEDVRPSFEQAGRALQQAYDEVR